MTVKLAQTAGFCFGVARAVQTVEHLLEQGISVCTLGPLIHNPLFIAQLEERGAKVVNSIEEVPDGYTLVLRTHGVERGIIDKLQQTNIRYYDATCPFVEKIRKIVHEQSADGRPVLIAGDANHPEVVGIRSCCNADSYVFENNDALSALLDEVKQKNEKTPIVVSQTTFNSVELKKSLKNEKLLCTNPKIFDTICSATSKRQEEAISLAAESDCMIVVGGRNSSNTAKLTQLCSKICKTYQIESADQLHKIDFSGMQTIGLTAGASTPVCIIKEVQKTMSDIINENAVPAVESEGHALNVAAEATEDWSFEQGLEESYKNLNYSQTVMGVVMHIAPNEIQVDIGRKQTGIIPLDEYSADPSADPMKELKVGDEIELFIMKTNDVEGTILLSKKRLDEKKRRAEIEQAAKDGAILEGTVVEVISKGLIVFSNGFRVFIPASLSTVPRNGRLEEMLDKTVAFKVIEFDRRRGAVGSIRDAAREQNKAAQAKFWETAAVEDRFTGTVVSLTDFGAFVDLGGNVVGMIHRSELSWKRIKHPSEIVNVGDVVDVYIKGLDTEKKKISLGYKRTEDNPWEILKRDYPVGSDFDVKIVSLTTFGAFAEIFPGMEGLIHISEISHERIAKPQDVLSIGETVRVQLLKVDFEKKHISLSIKALLEAPVKEVEEVVEEEVDDAPITMSIDEMIAKAKENEAAEAAAAEEVTAE
ncbi:MAG: bifunctional 4-hydroxy-3-methylbut-2-enyl diphosphate reductase/30S ribosomal protein S1 [Ruminococcaceae bacterium]|nr:bifunctional 4-hydroxy-3-methylbut-2-enyl diphosphate reductase/30S ribosomal protein S1 [Oscillospiraceae bacterium]